MIFKTVSGGDKQGLLSFADIWEWLKYLNRTVFCLKSMCGDNALKLPKIGHTFRMQGKFSSYFISEMSINFWALWKNRHKPTKIWKEEFKAKLGNTGPLIYISLNDNSA